MKQFCVYILASAKAGTLYVGVTSNFSRRIDQHQNDQTEGFTKRYHVHRLVYYETCDNAEQAIDREKQLKNWRRAWKVALITRQNPTWKDLSDEIV